MSDAQSIKTQINNAVRSRKVWNERLLDAIETGESEWTPEYVAVDDRCEFGQWLNAFPPSQREREYNNVRDLHAEFHREASQILALALEGEKETAKTRVGVGSHYDKLTTKLQISLELWRDLNI